VRYFTQRALAILSRVFRPHLVSNSRSAMNAHMAIGFNRSANVWKVIPNGVDADHYSPNDADGRAMRAELGISAEALVIGCVGRFAPEKGYAVLFNALSAAVTTLGPSSAARLHLVAVGNGVTAENPTLVRLASKSGLAPKNLHLLGKRADIQRLLRAFDVFVLPSISESFPNALLEAMATELACISANVGDCSDVLPNSRFVVQPRDPTALAERLVELLQADSQSRKSIGKLNRQEIVQRFSISAMVKAFDVFFVDAAVRRHASR
jgi:glycosyltransferase involved in cell wall biosynthesis